MTQFLRDSANILDLHPRPEKVIDCGCVGNFYPMIMEAELVILVKLVILKELMSVKSVVRMFFVRIVVEKMSYMSALLDSPQLVKMAAVMLGNKEKMNFKHEIYKRSYIFEVFELQK